MRQITSARTVNALANLPEIFPFISPDKVAIEDCLTFNRMNDRAIADPTLLDDPEFVHRLECISSNWRKGMVSFDECVTRPEHYSIFTDGKDDLDFAGTTMSVMFEWSAPDCYEMHTMARKCSRGGPVLEFMNECFEEMFLKRNALLVWGQISLDNKASRFFHRKVGGKAVGQGVHHLMGPVEFYRMTRSEWDAFLDVNINRGCIVSQSG